MTATAVRGGRPRARQGDHRLPTVSTYRDIRQALRHCFDGILSDDETTLRRAFADCATVTHVSLVERTSSTTGVEEFVHRIHRLHDGHARVVESPVHISIGVHDRTAAARTDFILLIGEAVFDGVGFYTLRAGPDAWEITQRVCIV
jgi:hypothetical protein